MNSLDPRVARLPEVGEAGHFAAKPPLDQFGTFEVFVQPREGKPFQHEGIVHAPNLEMAFLLAKEAFTRRFTCVSLYVADTRNVAVSPMADGNTTAYDLLASLPTDASGKTETYEVYHLAKRGKQHIHAATLEASSPRDALVKAGAILPQGKSVHNVWVIRTSNIFFTAPSEKDLWLTLPDKKFRDAADYKGGDKLKNFLDQSRKEA